MNIKNILILIICLSTIQTFSQCIPNSTYQDSLPNIFPHYGFPNGAIGVSYCQSWTMKTPSTLIDAAYGDSAMVTIDTLGNTIYIGDWIVDSVVTIDVFNSPPGLTIECSTPSCTYLGDEVGCVDISGIPTEIGTFSTDIVTNLWSHGVVSIVVGGVPLTIPVELDFFSVTGTYDTVSRYNITILDSSSLVDTCNGYYFTSISSKENNLDIIKVLNNPKQLNLSISSDQKSNYLLTLTDILGRKMYSEKLLVKSGINTYQINKHLENVIYIITLNNHNISFSKKIQITLTK